MALVSVITWAQSTSQLQNVKELRRNVVRSFKIASQPQAAAGQRHHTGCEGALLSELSAAADSKHQPAAHSVNVTRNEGHGGWGETALSGPVLPSTSVGRSFLG